MSASLPIDPLLDRVLEAACGNELVQAVILNGSRACPSIAGDCFQDYDVAYIVGALEPFLSDIRWLDVFGKRLIMQMPETMLLPPASGEGFFPFLMQLAEGKRLDLTLVPVEKAEEWCGRERYNKVLLDKSGEMKTLVSAQQEKRREKGPSEKLFLDCCNEFWWVITYPAKGIWRRELPYAQNTFQAARDMLDQMLEWHILLSSHFTRSGGKSGRHFQKQLNPGFWSLYEATYANSEYDKMWEALFSACRLFHLAAQEVADAILVEYPLEQEENVLAYLRRVRELPPEAVSLF